MLKLVEAHVMLVLVLSPPFSAFPFRNRSVIFQGDHAKLIFMKGKKERKRNKLKEDKSSFIIPNMAS